MCLIAQGEGVMITTIAIIRVIRIRGSRHQRVEAVGESTNKEMSIRTVVVIEDHIIGTPQSHQDQVVQTENLSLIKLK